MDSFYHWLEAKSTWLPLGAKKKEPEEKNYMILFIGGINSTGWRAKSLELQGYQVMTPDKMPNNNKTAILNRIIPSFIGSPGMDSYKNQMNAQMDKSLVDQPYPDLVMGVSQGGAMAMQRIKNYPHADLLLVSPAWRTYRVEPVVPRTTIIIHGTDDWIVKYSDSEYLAKKNGCKLIPISGEGHKMGSPLVNKAIIAAIEYFRRKREDPLKKI